MVDPVSPVPTPARTGPTPADMPLMIRSIMVPQRVRFFMMNVASKVSSMLMDRRLYPVGSNFD